MKLLTALSIPFFIEIIWIPEEKFVYSHKIKVMSVLKIKKMMNNFKSSIEDEKYLCSLNRLNGKDLIKLEKLKQVELGLANANDDYRLQHDIEKQLIIIDTVLQVRALSN